MVGYISRDQKQSEASMKYALFGAVCSAIMLYGISLLYGFTGSLYLNDPNFISGLNTIPPMALGVSLIMVWQESVSVCGIQEHLQWLKV